MSKIHQRRGKLFAVVLVFSFSAMLGQKVAIQGVVVDELTRKPISGIEVILEGSSLQEQTDSEGVFRFYFPVPLEEQTILISRNGYLSRRFPVKLEDRITKRMDRILLQPDLLQDQQQTGIIALTDHELDEEEGGFDNVSGLLHATKDVFLNAAAFDFSPTFFRPRGLNSENGKLLINGIEMNKSYNARPQWSNWGGLNDVQRNQTFSMGLSPSEVSFGDLAGTTNIIMRASEYTKGGKFSYAISNRAYTGRAMGTYSSGLNRHGWAYVISLSRRFAEESFRDGSIYDANSIFVGVEKKFNAGHSLNFTGIFTPNRRGKTSASTQEVYDLKGIQYNSYWGYQNGEIRNSRIGRIEEPILMLNHYWNLSGSTSLNTNIAYQFGQMGNSRLDYGGSRLFVNEDGQEAFFGGGSNPDPAYYQKLPSYFLRFQDDLNYTGAYSAQQEFIKDGQIDWPSLYSANHISTAAGGNSVYILYEDRNDDSQVSANTILRSKVGENIAINAAVNYRNLKSENFAQVLDLLGGNSFLDVDSFSEGEEAQSDLQNPNRLVGNGGKIKYHFDLSAMHIDAFAQAQFQYRNVDFFFGGKVSQTEYQRTGHFQNGNFPESSFGRSEAPNFMNYGAKAGVTFKLSGRHLFNLNAAYFTKAPNLRNSFSNSRQNNDIVLGLKSEAANAADISYIFRSPFLKARVTGYFTQFSDATEISFYYADGISGLGRNATTAFVQEVLTGVDKRHLGGEFGIEAQVVPDLKLKAVAAVGEFTYSNNPSLYLTSDDFEEAQHFGASDLKNYRLAGGPQRAYQVGIEYRDPTYWFLTASTNYFSHGFLDVAPLTRTQNFATDADGLPLLGYNEEEAGKLLEQEQFKDYFLVNLIGGKSWRYRDYYLGIFASVNNILNTRHKTGGYEQSRNANFRTLKEDQARDQPIFGSKYWYGYGTTYYAHIYVRF